MRSSAAQWICIRCTSAIRARPVLRPLRSCLGQRFVSLRTQPRPSRMVLADQVHRTPQFRDDGKPRPRAQGPFGGMNRRVANIEPRRVQQPRSRVATSGRRRDARDGDSRPRRAGHDKKALKMQRALADVSYERRSSLKERMQEYEAFDQFGLLPILNTALLDELFKGLTDVKPTPVQKLAIPAIMSQQGVHKQNGASQASQSLLLAAETGSGKTLAYLLPSINAMKMAEAEDPEIQAYNERLAVEKERQKSANFKGKPFAEPHPTMARPRLIVLVPTAELANQVGQVSKTLSHVAKFRTDILSSNLKPQVIQRNLYGPGGVDVVISTPHLLASIADSDPNILSRVSHLIIDEADSLFDRSFAPVTTSIIERAMPSLKQLICCSATIPRKLNNYLAQTYPKMKRITTPNLHAIPRRVQLGVIDVSKSPYQNNKDLACADAIYTIGRESARHEGPVKDETDVRRVLVFVNEREKTEEVADYLRSKGIDAQALHRDTPEKRHGEVLQLFTTSEPLRTTTAREAQPKEGKRSLSNVKVLVVTDLASRGIDTVAVRHVILYDVPHTTIDFIHRLGRAGRMNRRGRGIVLVGNDDRKDVVAEVKRSMFEGQALI